MKALKPKYPGYIDLTPKRVPECDMGVAGCTTEHYKNKDKETKWEEDYLAAWKRIEARRKGIGHE